MVMLNFLASQTRKTQYKDKAYKKSIYVGLSKKRLLQEYTLKYNRQIFVFPTKRMLYRNEQRKEPRA